jgi:hypothetical protein
LLDRLREHGLPERSPANVFANIELPAANMLSTPETILQIGSGAFLKGFVEDFVQLANLQANQWAGSSRFSANQIIVPQPFSDKTVSTHSFCEVSSFCSFR